ncbi:hypothetical protein TNCV_2408421 [Trichonephila clavipes]|nr:hypothetical protein TNCV_2408421 [Trichonephila clavipes]
MLKTNQLCPTNNEPRILPPEDGNCVRDKKKKTKRNFRRFARIELNRSEQRKRFRQKIWGAKFGLHTEFPSGNFDADDAPCSGTPVKAYEDKPVTKNS